jgi:drug/metabolite transporter (DMT)-like permease
MPARRLDALAAAGPWATVAVLLVAVLVLAPAAWRGRVRLADASTRALASVAAGGASFVLYANGLLYGQVAVVILMFYLTPIWSTLIARVWLGQRVSPWRYAALFAGLVGIGCVLRGAHGGLPLPHEPGDWLGLASGLLWAIASTGIHGHSRTGPGETNFVFCAGALFAAVLMAPLLGEVQLPALEADVVLPALAWVAVIGIGWWAFALTALMAATQVLEPPRVGILLMSEVIVGTISAAAFANEPFGPLVWVGGVLVIGAGLLESMPERRAAR